MSEYISGSSEDLEAFRAQLGVIYKDSRAVLIGSFGRQALYETFGWNAPPVALRKHLRSATISDRNALRDIDVLGIGGMIRPRALRSGPHQIDFGMQSYVDPLNPPNLSYGSRHISVDRRVFATRTRQLAGVPVRTLLVGTQLQVEQLAAHLPGREKYEVSFAEFSSFADSMRGNEREFLSTELYTPFDEYHRIPKAIEDDPDDHKPEGWDDLEPWDGTLPWDE